eukprot:TRINITY_DN4773_c0_g1_i2.p1 TRINITY_DN4773_c0_g1~~TRINITY_DN4773_c0_g1_i2.p1  ORF type:complete len:217 (+),score=54.03 TRINITY_DN4773_c0_g1_i2:3-653(+)
MALLKANEKAFVAEIAEINSAANLIPDLTGDEKKAKIDTANGAVENAHELIEQLELDVMDVPISERKPIQKRIAGFKTELEKAEKSLRKASVAMSGSSAARDELFGYDGSSEDARANLMSNTERLDRTSTRLQDGHRTALETQEVAIGIMDNLNEQRETIQRSRGRIRNVDTELSFSSRILNGMIARARRNKFIAFLIIAIALALIIVIIYLIATR